MDVTFPATIMESQPYLCTRFLWITLLWHWLSRNSHTITTSQLTGSATPIWKLITSAFVPHWRWIHRKARVKDSKHFLRSLIFFSSFAFRSARELEINGNMKFLYKLNQKEHEIMLANSQTLLPKKNLKCFTQFVTAVWNTEYIYIFKLILVNSAYFHSHVCVH